MHAAHTRLGSVSALGQQQQHSGTITPADWPSLPASPADFFATWCNGCQRSYPELCKIAMDPDMQKEVKFVKVRREGLTLQGADRPALLTVSCAPAHGQQHLAALWQHQQCPSCNLPG
jgi:thiol-disulfide isomerase/thioredoxin